MESGDVINMTRYVSSPYIIHQSTIGEKVKLYNDYSKRYHLLTEEEIRILLQCKKPLSYNELCSHFQSQLIDRCIERFLLLKADCIWQYHKIQHIEIETSTVCNWKCDYCPNSIYSRKPQHMELPLFKLILQRAKEYRHIKYVTLHSYNEPTLHPHFTELVDEVYRYGFRLMLYTNGSHLDEGKIQHMLRFGNLKGIVFNLPSLDRDVMEKMTGSSDYDAVIHAIDTAIKNGIDVTFSVQGKGEKRINARSEIGKKYPGCKIISHDSFDRAGALTNEYRQNYALEADFMEGCITMNEAVNITINGDLALCCNDYNHRHLFGNLKEHTWDSLLSGAAYTNIKKTIWGGQKAPTTFICRHCVMMDMSFERNQRIKNAEGRYLCE